MRNSLDNVSIVNRSTSHKTRVTSFMADHDPRITKNDLNSHLYPVIMAGGSGTRFWPLSRQLFPKQLLRIMGDETLIQQTMRRVVCASAPDRVMISTNPAQAESIRVQLS